MSEKMSNNSYTPDVERPRQPFQQPLQPTTDRPYPLDDKEAREGVKMIATSHPFVGRLGGVGAFVIDPHDQSNADVLKAEPDAAPGMSLSSQFDLRPFRTLALWKAASIEGIG